MFNFGFDRRTIIIILVIVLGFWLISAGTSGILNLLITIPGVLIALTFHEFAHAYAADKLGDETPRLQGRLNLNPFSHIDPIGFIFLIVARFGWGKPVQIDPRNFNGKYSISKAEAIVSAAGPIMNFILAFVFLIAIQLMSIFWPEAIEQFYLYATNQVAFTSMGWPGIIYLIVYYTASINVSLGVFNLIPVPPLDGSKILMHFLPYKAKEWFYRNEQIFYIVFLLLFITGLSSVIITPIFTAVFTGMNWIIAKLIGIFI